MEPQKNHNLKQFLVTVLLLTLELYSETVVGILQNKVNKKLFCIIENKDLSQFKGYKYKINEIK